MTTRLRMLAAAGLYDLAHTARQRGHALTSMTLSALALAATEAAACDYDATAGGGSSAARMT